jgi:hypothetical protein
MSTANEPTCVRPSDVTGKLCGGVEQYWRHGRCARPNRTPEIDWCNSDDCHQFVGDRRITLSPAAEPSSASAPPTHPQAGQAISLCEEVPIATQAATELPNMHISVGDEAIVEVE